MDKVKSLRDTINHNGKYIQTTNYQKKYENRHYHTVSRNV